MLYLDNLKRLIGNLFSIFILLATLSASGTNLYAQDNDLVLDVNDISFYKAAVKISTDTDLDGIDDEFDLDSDNDEIIEERSYILNLPTGVHIF